MPSPMFRALGGPVFAALGLLAFPVITLPASRSIEYLYINANEGSASGGHAAIKFGDEVFHFQHVPPGLLRVGKEDYAWFRYQYGYRENRTIRVHRIEVAEGSFKWLKASFNRRLLIQDEHFRHLQVLDHDARLLERLLSLHRHPFGDAPTIDLKALGFFLPDSAPTEVTNPSLLALRKHIETLHGPIFLQAKRQALRERLRMLKPAPSSSGNIEEGRFSPSRDSYAQRYADLLTNLAALAVLDRARPVRQETVRQPILPEFKLKPGALAKLAEFRQRLILDLGRLTQSERADWGYPLLVGMARLAVLDRSLDTGYLAVLDRFQEDGRLIENDEVDSGSKGNLFDQARQAFETDKSALASEDTLDERRYGQLEESANRFAELRQAMAQARPAKLSLSGPVPTLPAGTQLVLPSMDDTELAVYLESRRTSRSAFEERLKMLYRYDLLSHNCVTEIFRVINEAIGQKIDQAREQQGLGKPAPEARLAMIKSESARVLGGYVDESLNLIPYAAFQTVGTAYRVTQTNELPAYREERMRRDARREYPLLVNLRESNVLSSSIYRWNKEDSAFLFFTDDTLWPRPILGSFNLAVALGQTLTGVFSWPWDSGENLIKSLKGVFVSLPELVYFNIRKGSFPHLPWMNPNDQTIPSAD